MADRRQDPRRRRANIRLALVLAVAALGFYVLIWYLGSR